MRRVSTIVLALAALLFLTACPWRMMGQDAKKGGEVGFAIGGPEGAAIGSVVAALIGAFIRSREKRSLRQKGLLTDRRQQQEAITARTEKPRTPPQSLFPTDSTLGD